MLELSRSGSFGLTNLGLFSYACCQRLSHPTKADLQSKLGSETRRGLFSSTWQPSYDLERKLSVENLTEA